MPVGRHLTDNRLLPRREQGSIIVILATDVPMMPHQLNRLARRAAIGIGRGGTPGGNGSGDIFLAFSVANPMPLSQVNRAFLSFDWVNDEQCDPIYLAAVESVEEAVVNALLAAEDMNTLRPAGHICRALDHDQLMAVMKQHGRGGG